MKPLHDWIVVKEVDQKELHSDTVLFIDPHGLSHQNLIGEVIAVGPGKKIGKKVIPCQSQVGERVIFDRRKRTIYEPGHFMLKDSDVLAVLG